MDGLLNVLIKIVKLLAACKGIIYLAADFLIKVGSFMF